LTYGHCQLVNENGLFSFFKQLLCINGRKALCHKGKRPKCPHFIHSALHNYALRLGLWNRGGAREGEGGRFPTHDPSPSTNVSPSTPHPVPMPSVPHLPQHLPVQTHSEPFSAPIYVSPSCHTFPPSIAPISLLSGSGRHSAGAPLFSPPYPSEPCWIRVSNNSEKLFAKY